MNTARLWRAVVFGVAALLLTVVPAYGAVTFCRSDPTVVLSNGLVLDLSADIGTAPWNVQRVVYTLHIPRGVNPVLILRTRAWPTSVESFVIHADNPPGRYDSSTVVYTSQRGVPVTANLLVGLKQEKARGWDQQPLEAGLNAGNGLLPSILPPLLNIEL